MWDWFVQGLHSIEFYAIMPHLQLTLFACFILLADFLVERPYKYFNAICALLGIGFSAFALGPTSSSSRPTSTSTPSTPLPGFGSRAFPWGPPSSSSGPTSTPTPSAPCSGSFSDGVEKLVGPLDEE